MSILILIRKLGLVALSLVVAPVLTFHQYFSPEALSVTSFHSSWQKTKQQCSININIDKFMGNYDSISIRSYI